MDQKTQYFQLFPHFLLRGWDDVKYALVDSRSGDVMRLTGPTADALELAWNGIPVNSPIMLPAYRRVFDTMARENFGCLTEKFVEPHPEQRMKSAPCNCTSSICWSITGRCNMKCRHCYVEAADALYGELSLQECAMIMDQMAEANIYSVVLTGGEPLVRRDWNEFYRMLQERRIAVQEIYTNGLLVTDRWLDEFEKLETRKIRFSVSFDGIGHHDWLRGREGVERPVIEAIRRLVQHGYPVEIETALYRDNLDAMPETCDLLAELGVQNWKLAGVVDSNAWKPYAAEHTASTREINNAYLKLLDHFQRLGRPFSLQLDYRYWYSSRLGKALSPALMKASENSLKQPVCTCMRLHPYLLPDGTLMPCMPLSNCGLDKAMPNLREIPLVEALSSRSKFFDFISITPEEMFQRGECECASCEYRFQCCGGCRARAYAGGNLYGPDPELCDYFRNGTGRLFEPWYDR